MPNKKVRINTRVPESIFRYSCIYHFRKNRGKIEEEVAEAQLVFACEGRSCGQGVQWANRVFGERVLYGRDDLQRYRVYGPTQGEGFRLVLFSSARTADRQYLHAELLAIEEP